MKKRIGLYMSMLVFGLSFAFMIVDTAIARDPICMTCAGPMGSSTCDFVTIGYGCAWDSNGVCYDASPCGPH